MDNGFHTDMSVMKWTMVLELEDGELSVGCNEQNFLSDNCVILFDKG